MMNCNPDPARCNCDCHKGQNVKHFHPCCYKCPLCKANVKSVLAHSPYCPKIESNAERIENGKPF